MAYLFKILVVVELDIVVEERLVEEVVDVDCIDEVDESENDLLLGVIGWESLEQLLLVLNDHVEQQLGVDGLADQLAPDLASEVVLVLAVEDQSQRLLGLAAEALETALDDVPFAEDDLGELLELVRVRRFLAMVFNIDGSALLSLQPGFVLDHFL